MPRQLRVFLCHASQDKPAVRELYKRLKAEDWIDPWLDEEKLSFGQHWTTTIEDALSEADVVLIFLSKHSVQKEGFVQRELNYAWELSLEKPRNVIFLIPFRLDDCQIPRYLGSRQWGDYFGENKENTYQTLLRSLKQRHQQKLQSVVEENIALNQAQLNNIERELRNKWEQEQKEKAARENAELLTRANLEREAAQKMLIEFREKEERDSKAKAAREKAKHEKTEKGLKENVKPQTTKRTTPEKKKEEVNNSAPKRDLRFLGVGSVILIALILFGLSTFLNNPPVENVVKENTATLTPTKVSIETKTSIPLTSTSIAVSTIAVTATPVLEIGSTMISEKDDMVMVYVPAGEFIMGNDMFTTERPAHEVYLDAFWVYKTEVVNSMYEKCVFANECSPPISVGTESRVSYYGNSEYDNYPVVMVTWDMAKKYCEWIGGYLPTEAEWEKAARGPDGRKYPWGDQAPNSGYLNFNSINDDTMEVGSYPSGSSIYGVLDMSGNVWEWVADWFSLNYYDKSPEKNPLGPESGKTRIIRGGSYYRAPMSDAAKYVTATKRYELNPERYETDLGFRCVMDATP